MEFNKAYNREEFITFLKDKFLPEEDSIKEKTVSPFPVQTKYSTKATRMGACHHTLDLEVYEIRHTSKHDARVGLSKEAFRLLAEEGCARVLVLFVPEDDNSNYRFSLDDLRMIKGEKVTDGGLRMITSRWSKNGWITKTSRGHWKKKIA